MPSRKSTYPLFPALLIAATASRDEAASWAEVEAAAGRWAQLFKDLLDRNLGRS
jgi:hypothetical protein